jgi:hypothetical protein
MAITNGYTSLAVYKQRFYDEGQGDTKDDAAIEAVIEAVSRSIDDICWRRFCAATETRYYTAEKRDTLMVDDLLSVSTDGFKTDEDGDRIYEITWETTDYDLMPFNAVLDGVPYQSLVLSPEGDYWIPTISKGVELTGSFGYSATTPPAIVEACLLGSHLTHARRNSPYGVSGAAAVGSLTGIIQSMKQDPLIMDLLTPYISRF